eukprot:3734452-Ditylum_brightwellii.AAC.1
MKGSSCTILISFGVTSQPFQITLGLLSFNPIVDPNTSTKENLLEAAPLGEFPCLFKHLFK